MCHTTSGTWQEGEEKGGKERRRRPFVISHVTGEKRGMEIEQWKKCNASEEALKDFQLRLIKAPLLLHITPPPHTHTHLCREYLQALPHTHNKLKHPFYQGYMTMVTVSS